MQLSIAEISKTQFYEPRFNNYLNLRKFSGDVYNLL